MTDGLHRDDDGMLLAARLPDKLLVLKRSARRAAIEASADGGEVVAPFHFDISSTLEEIHSTSPYLSSLVEGRCQAVRDLFAGTPEAGTVILTCGKLHHMDVHAHRMTNPDGSVTTWRR